MDIKEADCDLGLVGLGVMGRNLVLNMVDHGFRVAGYDKDTDMVQALAEDAPAEKVAPTDNVKDFIAALRQPRTVMMLVPAGPPVDAVIDSVAPHLQAGDLIVDGGNSHFQDSEVRAQKLAEQGIQFLGVGISGGEYGARHGPSIMPGGPAEAYERVRPIFEAVAAHVEGEPCVTYLGPGSAGHFVKMVHNGIEYGLMQLIAESYDLMKRALGLNDDELHEVFQRWQRVELSGYLMEITADIFTRMDPRSDRRLIDVIEDAANQKGTGMWTAQEALELQVPAPIIDVAVVMRNLSAFEGQRRDISQALTGAEPGFEGDRQTFIHDLEEALYAAMILTYSQGMAMLHTASEAHDYGLKLEDVARIWRGGCIIRSELLEPIRSAFQQRPDLPNLLLDPALGKAVAARQDHLRRVVAAATGWGLPTPAFALALAYFDAMRSRWLPANLIQAQRDYFGAHTYERIDAKGRFHTEWRAPLPEEVNHE